MSKIHYEPHPVSPERKAELAAKGYKIVDAKFAPKSPAPVVDPAPEPVAEAEKPKRRKKRA